MSFCSTKNKLEYPYKIVCSVLFLKELNHLWILVLYLIQNSTSIDMIICKANSRFGIIKRWSRNFNDLFITKTLFVSLVRSVLLEFACQDCCPYYQYHIDRIQSILKQFFVFALSNLNWSHRYQLPKYEYRLLLLDMNTLEDRRNILNSLFIFKLLIGDINCKYLLNLCEIKCLIRILRSFCLLHTLNHRQN